MVNVSKKYLDNELRAQAWGRFLQKMKISGSPDTCIINLRSFLTPSEIIMLEKRLSIPVLLEQKLSYREIGRIIDVSQDTISFVKQNLTKKPAGHKKYSSSIAGTKLKRAESKYIAGVFPRRYKGATSPF